MAIRVQGIQRKILRGVGENLSQSGRERAAYWPSHKAGGIAAKAYRPLEVRRRRRAGPTVGRRSLGRHARRNAACVGGRQGLQFLLPIDCESGLPCAWRERLPRLIELDEAFDFVPF